MSMARSSPARTRAVWPEVWPREVMRSMVPGGQGTAPGRLANRFDAGQQAELAEHEQVVPRSVVTGDLAAADLVDVDLVGFEGPAGGRHGAQHAAGPDTRRELAQVGALGHDPVHHGVAA